MRARGLVLILLMLAVPAVAATLPEAEHLYRQGNFRAAALAGQSSGSADGVTLAARARLVRAAYLLPPSEAREELEDAERLARAVLEKNPDHVEALLNLAIALGYRSRIAGEVSAHFSGMGKEAKRAIDRALALAPDSAWALAVEGGWHAEVVSEGGSMLANLLYGANRRKALDAFEKAVRQDGDNLIVRLEYAKALVKLKGRDGWRAASRHLDRALSIEPRGHFDTLLRDKARLLKEAIATGYAQEVKATLLRIEPFRGPEWQQAAGGASE